MRLDRNARRHERPRLSQAADDSVGIEAAALRLKEAEWRFENVIRGGPSERREVDGQSPIFGGVSCLEWLRHRAEIIPEAAAFGCHNTERIRSLQWIQAAQLGAGRGATERSACAGGVKTVVVVAWRNRFGNFALHFHADVVSQHE